MQLRGALRGAVRPVPMQQLLRLLGIHAGATSGGQGAPISAIVEELVQEGAIRGSLKAGGGVWVPDVHALAQQEAVLSFYHQNQYIGCGPCFRAGLACSPVSSVKLGWRDRVLPQCMLLCLGFEVRRQSLVTSAACLHLPYPGEQLV